MEMPTAHMKTDLSSVEGFALRIVPNISAVAVPNMPIINKPKDAISAAPAINRFVTSPQ